LDLSFAIVGKHSNITEVLTSCNAFEINKSTAFDNCSTLVFLCVEFLDDVGDDVIFEEEEAEELEDEVVDEFDPLDVFNTDFEGIIR
jgi:hypothetical protein